MSPYYAWQMNSFDLRCKSDNYSCLHIFITIVNTLQFMHWYKHRSLFFCFKSKNASYLEGSGAKLEAIIRNFTVATTHPVCLHLVVLGSRNNIKFPFLIIIPTAI